MLDCISLRSRSNDGRQHFTFPTGVFSVSPRCHVWFSCQWTRSMSHSFNARRDQHEFSSNRQVEALQNTVRLLKDELWHLKMSQTSGELAKLQFPMQAKKTNEMADIYKDSTLLLNVCEVERRHRVLHISLGSFLHHRELQNHRGECGRKTRNRSLKDETRRSNCLNCKIQFGLILHKSLSSLAEQPAESMSEWNVAWFIDQHTDENLSQSSIHQSECERKISPRLPKWFVV